MKAIDIMTPRVITIRSDAAVKEAVRVMLQNRISGLPVVDAAGKLVGIVTEGDFLRRAEVGTERRRPHWLEFVLGPGRLADEYVHAHGRNVAQVMTPDVMTVAEDTSVDEVARLMERHNIKRLPVMRGDKIVGIISRANLLLVFARLAAKAAPVAAGDAEIRKNILAAFDKLSWAPRASLNVTVQNGVAELHGAVFDDRQRQGLRVAVENVPGVKAVKDNLIWIEPMSGVTLGPPESDLQQSAAGRR
jgi:CBS domain-containing protein